MKTTSIISFVILVTTLTIQSSLAQWQQTGLNSGDVQAIAVHGNVLVTGGAGLKISTDNGVNWFSGGIGFNWALGANDDYIFVPTSVYIHRSSNLGANWSQHPAQAADGFATMTVDGTTIYAGAIHYGIRRSTNNGANWHMIPFPYGTVRSIDINGSNIYTAIENDGVSVSTNSGSNWSPGIYTLGFMISVKYNNGLLFAGARDSGVYISNDNGASWIRSSLNNRTIYSIVATGNNVFAGTTNGGVYFSPDNGTNWSQVNEGLTDLRINAMKIHDNIIYAGTQTAGLWKRPLSELVGINQVSSEVPTDYSLSQNYPNPFNPSTNFEFKIADFGLVRLTIYDVTGRIVETLLNSALKPGTYKAEWNAANYPSGVYFYTLSTGDFSKTNKMILVK
jgi:hypothetical protein